MLGCTTLNQVAAGRMGTPGTKAPLRNLVVEVSEKK